MNSIPLVSVLMPAYNAEKFIAAAISSILHQDYSNWELLILNDASTDRTTEIIGGFSDSRIKVFQHLENRGYLLSCNELFEQAKGDFITFLDADDMCPKNRLSLCLQEFESNPELDFLTTDHHRISESDSIISINSVEVDYERYTKDPNYSPTICCATIFLRRSLLLKVGGYRDFFKNIGGEDYFWLWELSKNGLGKHLNFKLYDYRQHQHQTSKNHENELSLFLPEVLGELRSEFHTRHWDKTTTKNIETNILNQFLSSAFELNLRKAQRSLNAKDGSFSTHAYRSFLHVKSLKQLRDFLHLLYSWMVRKGRMAGRLA
ncbi:MAG: glycosyltransferase family 2 protein [Flavobacteriales bacterium]|nr:glycosyltransferase family 2 protein [Flavobacteriales bacterium]